MGMMQTEENNHVRVLSTDNIYSENNNQEEDEDEKENPFLAEKKQIQKQTGDIEN